MATLLGHSEEKTPGHPYRWNHTRGKLFSASLVCAGGQSLAVVHTLIVKLATNDG